MECFLQYQIKSNSLEWKPFEGTSISKDESRSISNEANVVNDNSVNLNTSRALPDLIDFGADDDNFLPNGSNQSNNIDESSALISPH